MSDSDIINNQTVFINKNITENSETPKVEVESLEFQEVKKWDDFGLEPSILRGIYSHGFENPSPIQMKGILPIMKGRDVIAQSQSGTGKTATFVIGALSQLDLSQKTVQVFVLVPTRELACQIEQVFEGIGMSMENLKTHVLVGGRSIDESMKCLKYDCPQVVIGCIGRTCDMIKRRALNLSNLKLLIIDEADEMLSYGFREDVYFILDRLPLKRQVVVFSATMSIDIIDRLEEITTEAVHITVKREALKIRLFDGLFRSSDNIPRNILVNDNHELLSIDEGDIFGKREKIFNKNDWFTKPENCSHVFVESVVDELLNFNQLTKIKKLFEYYQFMNFDEFKLRYESYKMIVMSELQ